MTEYISRLQFKSKFKVMKLFSHFRHANHHLSDNQIFIVWMGNQFVQNVLVHNKKYSYIDTFPFISGRKGTETLDMLSYDFHQNWD